MRFIAVIGFTLAVVIFSATTSLQQASASEQNILQPPPEPVYEVDPGERPGFILSPGYWRWNGTHHVWVRSRWIPARPGYSWIPDRWEQQGNEWHFSAGHWQPNDAVAVVTEDEEVVAEPEETKPVAKGKPQPRNHHRKKIDYSDTTKWPRVIHH